VPAAHPGVTVGHTTILSASTRTPAKLPAILNGGEIVRLLEAGS